MLLSTLTDHERAAVPADHNGHSGPEHAAGSLRPPRWLFLVVFLAVALLPLLTAGRPQVFDELSGQYSSTSWEMVRDGDWLVPHLAEVPRLKKPPMVYWFTAASIGVFGRNEFAARLPVALALIGVLWMTGLIGRRLHGEGRALLAVLFLGSFLGTALLGKTIMPELFVTLGMCVGFYAALRAVDTPEKARAWALLFWFGTAFSAMAKGLPGAVFTPGVVGALALARPALRVPLLRLLYPPGLLLFLAITLPWPLYIENRFPGYIWDNLFNEHVGHVLDRHYPHDTVATPAWLFWIQHLMLWFPWAFFLPAAFMARPPARSGQPEHPAVTLPIAWLVVVAVVLTAAGQRQDYYSMPLWPAAALLLGRMWDADPERKNVRWTLAVPLGVLLSVGIAGVIAFLQGERILAGLRTDTESFADRNNMVGSLTGFSADVWRELWPYLGLASGLLVLGAGAALACLWIRGARRWWWAPAAAGLSGLLVSAIFGLDLLSPYFGLKPIGQALTRMQPGEALVVFDGPSNRASSLPFYTDVPVRWLERPETEFAVRSRGIGKDRFVTEEEIVRRWKAGEPVYLVLEQERLEHWRRVLGERLPDPAARSGTRVLLVSGRAG